MFIRYQGFTESGFGLCLCSSLARISLSGSTQLCLQNKMHSSSGVGLCQILCTVFFSTIVSEFLQLRILKKNASFYKTIPPPLHTPIYIHGRREAWTYLGGCILLKCFLLRNSNKNNLLSSHFGKGCPY